MSKLERQVAVKFRRKHAIKGNEVKLVRDPGTELTCQKEMDAITNGVGYTYYVYDGDETGALIQLAGWHDLSWIPIDCLERTL